MKPRPYQTIAINSAVKALQKFGKALVVLATALGKTLVSALVVKKIGGKGIFLVHNNDILEDAMKEYRKVFPNAVLGLYNGYTKDITGADIVFASFQTMTKNLRRFKRNQFAWMVVDESHHSSADTYRKVIEKFDCKKLGITATPDRIDLQDIRQFFGDEVVNIQLEEAIARGWLPRIEYHLISDESMDNEKLQEIAAEVGQLGKRRLTVAEIDRRVFIRTRDEKISEIVAGYNEKAVVFCRNVKHTENFKKSLPSSQTYHSSNKREKNKKALESLRDGNIRRVLAVNAFNEGINVPDVGLIVFARATDSENIFRQQLGRGLRPGKEKLIVLDFVGNIERMRMIRNMTERIADLHEEFTSKRDRDGEGYRKDSLMLSGKGFEFTFTKQVVDLFDVLDRVSVDFYPTWQEASRATAQLGIKTCIHYKIKKLYTQDPRLPSNPNTVYSDFPGWQVFLGGVKKNRYQTWQEASVVAIRLGLKSQDLYYAGYKQDDKLPATPHAFYQDFPGYVKFLTGKGKEFYKTWKEAAQAALTLEVKTRAEYVRSYKKDDKLPGYPETFYSDFPGWDKFLGKKKKTLYTTWQQAGWAAIKLKITGCISYRTKRLKDVKLPGNPDTFYSDFPGWRVFLGGKPLYKCWQDASKAAKKLKIKTSMDYLQKRIQDGSLPSEPKKSYKDFPGWDKFLGKI
jgi:superfamily II DNA or RNA helicase